MIWGWNDSDNNQQTKREETISDKSRQMHSDSLLSDTKKFKIPRQKKIVQQRERNPEKQSM